MTFPDKELAFSEVWEGIKTLTGWSSYKQLADFLKIKQPSISGAKSREVFPVEWAHKVALEFNSSTEWILSGEGSMHRAQDNGNITREPDPAWNQGENIGWDSQLLIDLIAEYEIAIEEQKAFIVPEEKAKMYAQLYEIYRKEGAKIDAKEIRRTLRLVVNKS